MAIIHAMRSRQPLVLVEKGRQVLQGVVERTFFPRNRKCGIVIIHIAGAAHPRRVGAAGKDIQVEAFHAVGNVRQIAAGGIVRGERRIIGETAAG